MVIEVKEITFYGFLIQRVEDKGWQIVLNEDTRILFPTLQDAQGAAVEFHNVIVPKRKGKLIKPYK